MAPSLANKAETPLGIPASSPLVGSLGSAVFVVLMILLLLLCFPFRRKKRQLSTRVLKREPGSSQLIHVAKLEDEPSPERKSPEHEDIRKGNALPCHLGERQPNVNGVAAEFHCGNANSPKGQHTVLTNHQRMEGSPKLQVDHLGGLGPEAPSPPSAMTPNSVQFRKLPLTPEEVRISRTEPLNRSVDNQVYESIRLKEAGLCSRDCLVETTGSDVPSGRSPKGARAQGPLAESVGSGRMDPRTAAFNGTLGEPGTSLPSDQSPGQLQEMQSETEAPLLPVFDAEKRLSALYARVCKKPKASSQPQPQPHDKTTEEEEEEPPPIPEKHFENVYESLCVETEAQDGGVPGTGMVSPPEA